MIKKKPSGNARYWTQDTDLAIIEYNAEQDNDKRNAIYNERIYPALHKLSENVYNVFKFQYIEMEPHDAIMDAVIHMTINLCKFNPSKKSTAFSYFTIACKNHLIKLNKDAYKRKITQKTINLDDEHSCEMVDAEVSSSINLSKSSQLDNFELTSEQMAEFLDMSEWAKDANIPPRDKKFIERARELLLGERRFMVSESGNDLLWDSVNEGISRSRYYGPVAIRRSLRKYRRVIRGEKIPGAFQGQDVITRHCPSCNTIIKYEGPNAKYNRHYAEVNGSRCLTCANTYPRTVCKGQRLV